MFARSRANFKLQKWSALGATWAPFGHLEGSFGLHFTPSVGGGGIYTPGPLCIDTPPPQGATFRLHLAPFGHHLATFSAPLAPVGSQKLHLGTEFVYFGAFWEPFVCHLEAKNNLQVRTLDLKVILVPLWEPFGAFLGALGVSFRP